MAKGLKRAEKAVRAIGAEGITLYAASRANSDTDEFTVLLRSANLLALSRWASAAAGVARAEKQSRPDGKRGRTPDANLRSLVTVLAQQYALVLGVRPTHSSDVQTGEGTSLFDDFVISSIRDFAPALAIPAWRQIDRAIRQQLYWLRQFSTLFPDASSNKNEEIRP
jgi:hypothetical protein